MKQIKMALSLGLLMSLSQPAFAQVTAQEGLDRLKANSENAHANLENYQKNLKIVDANLAEVQKAKAQIDAQKADVTMQVKLNQTSLSTVEKQESDLNKLVQQEDKETQNEEQKVKDLEKVIAQLKDNQTKRQQNVVKYKQQLEQVSKEKAEWKTHQDLLLKQQKDVNDRLAAVKKTEKDWTNKKRGYEGEIGRWQKDADKHQKLLEQYTAMANHKE